MSARYERAVQEAFYWGEKLDNGSTFADYGETPTPGIDAALSGLWRGRNKADNEQSESVSQSRREKEEAKKRYTRE